MRHVLAVPRSLGFYLLFYGGSVLIVVACLVALLGKGEQFRRLADSWSLWHRWCIRWMLGQKIVVEGVLPAGPIFVVLKHESFFEAIDLPQLVPYPGVFAKAELFQIPLWGWASARYGLVEVQRDQGAKALRHMMVAARRISADQGRALVLFPEGTRVPHDQCPKLKAGFAGLYKLLNLPIVAVAVNSGPLYQRWWKLPGQITYRIAEPIPPGLPRDEVEQRVWRAINALNRP